MLPMNLASSSLTSCSSIISNCGGAPSSSSSSSLLQHPVRTSLALAAVAWSSAYDDDDQPTANNHQHNESTRTGPNNKEEGSATTTRRRRRSILPMRPPAPRSPSLSWNGLPPRARAATLMGAAMALHFGGYEFLRSACLTLFTSGASGFEHPSAFPLASALVSPFSVGVLYIYGRLLSDHGPRGALRRSTLYCIAFILGSAAILSLTTAVPRPVRQAVTGLAFLFQSSYSYALNAQQWSFLDSILTPDEGARWFTVAAGVGSCACAVAGGLVPVLLPRTGLRGLLALTAVPLAAALWCGDRAYAVAREHGFDPTEQHRRARHETEPAAGPGAATTTNTDSDENNSNSNSNSNSKPQNNKSNRLTDAIALFRRVPTLGALFSEGIAFQSLSTILNVAFVQALKATVPDDLARSSYTGRFYALISGVSAVLQFGLLPVAMNRLEPKHIWRVMPILPALACLFQLVTKSTTATTAAAAAAAAAGGAGSHQLLLLASALFLTKTMDYSFRSVVYNMVYQPLDFESRFMGKEIISVFGSRLGKSGMSLALSALAAANLLPAGGGLSSLALVASGTWTVSAWWLSSLLPSQAEAQRTVEQRREREQQQQQEKQQQQQKKKETAKKEE